MAATSLCIVPSGLGLAQQLSAPCQTLPLKAKFTPVRSAAIVQKATTIKGEDLAVLSPPPTPVLPSGEVMADFLLTYGRTLHHLVYARGDTIAAAGLTVLERVRIGLMGLLGHPMHGVSGGSQWHRNEMAAERWLNELEKDLNMIKNAHDKAPPAIAVQLASTHCLRAAQIVKKL